MNKPKLLYLSSNDGSDMRINKELSTLHKEFEITFIGVGQSNNKCFATEYCKYFYLIDGKRNQPATIIKQVWLFIKLTFKKYDSIHVINEQLMIFFYPFIFGKHVVLDIFDSIFLMQNKSKNKLYWLKRIIYAPVKVILVTDANRKELMPDFTHKKIRILENFPKKYHGKFISKDSSNFITILYNGWLGLNRGSSLIIKILEADSNIKVIMAGWFADEESRQLAQHPQVDYRGIMSQDDALEIAAIEADFILCVYAPINENNINASPNKVYDAIQTRTPLITNSEIKIAQFVEKNAIGVIINDYSNIDIPGLIANLKAKRGQFIFDDTLVSKYVWEEIENELLLAHRK